MKLLMYLLECSIILASFYLIYYLLLRRQTTFSTNRIYLLGRLLSSIIIPAIDIQIPGTAPLTISILQIKEVVITSNLSKTKDWVINMDKIIYMIAFISCGVYFLWFAKQLWYIYKMLNNSLVKKKKHIYIVETKHNHAFSFFNYIFINQNIPQTERKKIILHEKAHIQQWHTIDRLLIDLILVCQWFNPIAWLYRKSIIENHEFLADASTLKHGVNQIKYQQLLLNQLFRTNQVQFVTYFNQSLIKKRIMMMTKNTNKKAERIRFFLALPLALIIAISFSFTGSLPKQVLKPTTNNVLQALNNAVSPINQKDTITKSTVKKSKSRRVFVVLEENATFQGGDMETFRAWILQNLNYPESAAKKGIQGKVILSFIVEADGKIEEVRVLRGVDPVLDAEGIRVIKSSPAWVPGRQEGKAVAQQFTIPIAFKVQK